MWVVCQPLYAANNQGFGNWKNMFPKKWPLQKESSLPTPMFQVWAVNFREIYVGDFFAIPTVLVTCFGMMSLRDQPTIGNQKVTLNHLFFSVFSSCHRSYVFFRLSGRLLMRKKHNFFLKSMATWKRKKRKNHSKKIRDKKDFQGIYTHVQTRWKLDCHQPLPCNQHVTQGAISTDLGWWNISSLYPLGCPRKLGNC